jgi:membrane protein implicated in regulation of membrane protease activity
MKIPTKTELENKHMTRIMMLVLAMIAACVALFVATVYISLTGWGAALVALPCMFAVMYGIWKLFLWMAYKEEESYMITCALLRFMEGYEDSPNGWKQCIQDRELLEYWGGFEEWRIYKQTQKAGH